MSQRTQAPYLLFFSIFLLILFTLSPAHAKQFTSEVGGFSVNFPETPQEKNADKHTFVGTIKETYFIAKTPTGGYLVGYTHLPGIMIFFGGHNNILNKAKQIFLDKEAAQEVSYSDTDVDGRHAKILKFKTSDGKVGKAYFVFDGKRVYLVMGKSSKGLGPVNRFLTSFRLFLKPQDVNKMDRGG